MNYSELIDKAKNKDEKAIEQLFELTSQKGYYVALKYLKSKEDAHDILQDAYVSALSKLDSLKDPEKFDKWLYQIIANKAKNYLVKNKPLLFEQLEKEEEDAIRFEDTIQDDTLEFQPKENCDYQELKQALKDLIDELPEDQRMCLLMYYFEELSINEIAESLELNTNTIKSRLNYARKKIKDKVEDLQKKGTHLYGIAPIPFLLWMLQEEAKEVAIPHVSTHLLCSQIAKGSAKSVTKQGITVLGKTISVKTIAVSGISAAVILGGGTAYYQHVQKQEQQEIYDSLSIQFTDQSILEYGQEIDLSSLVKNHTGDRIKQLNKLDMKKVGKQTIQFLVSKDNVDRKFEFTIEVKDTNPPILTLIEEAIELTVGDEFDPQLYIKDAIDEVDGELKNQVVINNPVDMSKAGEYKVTYSLKDKNDLQTESVLNVTVLNKEEVKLTTKNEESTKKLEPENVTDNRVTVGLNHLGVSMKIPPSFQCLNSAPEKVGEVVGSESYKYIMDIGTEGYVMTVYYFPYNDFFNNSLEGNHGLRMKSLENYTGTSLFQSYEAYDRGSYFLAFKQGLDYPITGTAWVGPNDHNSISIRIEGKSDNSGVYAISLHVNNYDRGYSIGIDGFEEERIRIAREIFNSIQ